MSTIASKSEGLTRRLRRQIVRGRFQPGQRLPNRAEIGERYDVGVSTIQRALDELRRDGFIHARGRAGTFVTERPPHLANIAIAYPNSRGNSSRLYNAIRDAAELRTTAELRFTEYVVSLHVEYQQGRQRLLDDAAHHRFGGVFFAYPPSNLKNEPTLHQPDLPRVALAPEAKYGPSIAADLDSFRHRALDHLEARGCRRIAHLSVESHFPMRDVITPVLRQRGVEIRPYWMQSVAQGVDFRSATNLVHLLMKLPEPDRPDGLILHDDNLVEPAVAGLVAAHASVPHDLAVVALTNFPSIAPSPAVTAMPSVYQTATKAGESSVHVKA